MAIEKMWKKEMESGVQKKWNYDFNDNGKVYSIDTPPPYVNTPIHIGHAATYSIMDMIARYKRMNGFSVLFPLGLDRNGLPIEVAAEKKFKVNMSKMSREEFVKLCKKVLEESSTYSMDSFKKLGISFNSWKVGSRIGDAYFTDSDEYRIQTQSSFIELWRRGLIYEDERINNYCPGCKTTIADAEIDYKELDSKFYDVVFMVKETNEDIIIGTTRPELICTCGMIIFNPDDERWKHLEGKTAITPVFGKVVPIKSHSKADMGKGTGLVMMCSAGDISDIRFFREMKLEPVIAINSDGKMNRHAGVLEGLEVEDARNKIVEVLKEKNLIIKERHIKHRTPICERSKDLIEFISMPEFYLKQDEFKKDMEKIADELNFFSPESRQLYLDLINTISADWPISRRRYYATEIPLWYCKKCRYVYIPEKGKYYKPWKEKPPVKECPECSSTEFIGEERVFDTWFDSSISPLYILGYERHNIFFRKHQPCSLRPQGKEIIRTWLHYTLLKNFLMTGKTIFKDVWIHHHIVDDKGYKMSKSIGNIIDPHVILDKYGAEPFRLWVSLEGNITQTDLKCSFERIEGAGKTLTKLWNIARFVSGFKKPDKFEPEELDKWIITEVDRLIETSKGSYENYDFHVPAVEIRHFIWETFASHYIEMVKNRAYNDEKNFSKKEQEAAIGTLYHCLEKILELLSPIIPMFTYKLYEDIWGKAIDSIEFPKPVKMKTKIKTEEIEKLNSIIWKAKKEKGLSLKDKIKKAIITKRLEPIKNDLIQTHGIEKLEFGENIEIMV